MIVKQKTALPNLASQSSGMRKSSTSVQKPAQTAWHVPSATVLQETFRRCRPEARLTLCETQELLEKSSLQRQMLSWPWQS